MPLPLRSRAHVARLRARRLGGQAEPMGDSSVPEDLLQMYNFSWFAWKGMQSVSFILKQQTLDWRRHKRRAVETHTHSKQGGPSGPIVHRVFVRRCKTTHEKAAKDAFAPDFVVLQCGADGLAGDPYAVWNWALGGEGGFGWCAQRICGWGAKVLLLGGGNCSNIWEITRRAEVDV